jgi:hypothetical protein
MKRITLLIYLIIVSLQLKADGTIQINPFTSGIFTQDDVWNFSFINNESTVVPYVFKIQVNIEGGQLLEVVTPPIMVNPGIFNDFSQARNISIFNYYQNELSASLQNNGFCEYHRLNICIYVYRDAENIIVSNVCQDYTSVSHKSLHLIYPSDRDTIETVTPLLHWTAINIPPASKFKLRIAEVFDSEDAVTAIDINPPYYFDEVPENVFLYPLTAQPLEFNHTYVWQVIAILNDNVIATSEIWTFTIMERSKLNSTDECYRIITKEINNDNYVYDKSIKFTYENRTNEKALNYTIRMADSKESIKNIPAVEITNGLNRVMIPISAISGLSNEKTYLLTVNNKKHESFHLSFKIAKQ